MPRETDTMLMLSDSWLTTHTSSLLRGLTETGSSPTGISAMSVGAHGCERSKTDKRASGVFTANNREPSADTRIGLVSDDSKFANASGLAGAVMSTGDASDARQTARTTHPGPCRSVMLVLR